MCLLLSVERAADTRKCSSENYFHALPLANQALKIRRCCYKNIYNFLSLMIPCRARLVNVFSDPLKGFSGKGSARNCFKLILKLGLPTQKKLLLILTELPAVLLPRRASQLLPAGKIHSGPFHHHGSSRSWTITEKQLGFPHLLPSATLFNTTSKRITYQCHKNIQSEGEEAHKSKTTLLFCSHISWKAGPLCAPPAAALQRCREGLHVHPLFSWVLWNTWNQSVLFVRVAPLPVSHWDLCPCSWQQEVMPNLEHAAPGACGTGPCNG